MYFFLKSIFFSVCLFLVVGCSSSGNIVNPFQTADSSSSSSSSSSSTNSSSAGYYISAFRDLPIPKDMFEDTSETVITQTISGLKCGIQVFHGRVQAASLVSTMRGYMESQGWTLRSLLRAKRTLLIYEKKDRVCSLYISEGIIYTEMQIFMSSRLDGDAASSDEYIEDDSLNNSSSSSKKLAE